MVLAMCCVATGRFVGPLVGTSAAPGVQQGWKKTPTSRTKSRLKYGNPLAKYFLKVYTCNYMYICYKC